MRALRQRRNLAVEAVLLDLQELATQHHSAEHPHSASAIGSMTSSATGTIQTLQELKRRGLAVETDEGLWHLSSAGEAKANELVGQLGGKR